MFTHSNLFAATLALYLATAVSANSEARLHGLLQRERLLDRADLPPMRPAVLPDGMIVQEAPSSSSNVWTGRRRGESSRRSSRRVAFARHAFFESRNSPRDADTDDDAQDLIYRQINMPLPIQIRAASANDHDDDIEDNYDCVEDIPSSVPYTSASHVPVTSYTPSITTSFPVTSAAVSPSSSSQYFPASTSNPSHTSAAINAANAAGLKAAYAAPAPSSSSPASSAGPVSYSAPAPPAFTPQFQPKNAKNTTTTTISKLFTPKTIANGTLTAEKGCQRYHTVQQGDICLSIVDQARDLNLTLAQLYILNPAINSECTNLQIGWSLCLGKKSSRLFSPSASAKKHFAPSAPVSTTTVIRTSTQTVRTVAAVIQTVSDESIFIVTRTSTITPTAKPSARRR